MPFPTPVDLPDPGIEPESLAFPALGGFFTIEPPESPIILFLTYYLESEREHQGRWLSSS